jgi:hypothetical protein
MAGELEIAPGDATAHLIRESWADVLAEAGQPGSDIAAAVAGHGIDPEALSAATLAVDEESRDFGASILVAVTIEVSAHILKSLWDEFVHPRLQERFNVDAGDVIA